MASMSCSDRPARSRRRPSWRRLKPLSTSTRVTVTPSRASTTSALPLLPEPRLHARSIGAALAQLLAQEVEDPVAARGPLRLALRVLHRHHRLVVALAREHDAELRRWNRLLPREHLREETLLRLLLRLVVGIEVADEIDPLGPIAILDGEGAAIECKPDPSPGAVERLVHVEALVAPVASLNDTR